MAYRNRVTSAPALVNSVIETTSGKRNGSILTLQNKMETTSQWLDDAITSAKRKIVEGTSVPIQDVKKSKTIQFKRDDGAPLSPIRDKENSPNPQGPVSAGASSPEEGDRVHFKIKPPPSAVKRKVNGMRVVDLKKELKSKGIETKGLKKDLQHRLLQAYETVEKIMSPPAKVQPNATVPAEIEEKNNPPTTEEVEDHHPDSESVEVIVFSSSGDDQDVQMESKPSPTRNIPSQTEAAAKEPDQGQTTSSSCGDNPVKEGTKSVVKKPSVVPNKTKFADKAVEAKELSIEAMDIDSHEETAAKLDERSDVSPNRKRFSMMDCSESDEKSTDHGAPKVTLSIDSSTLRGKTPSIESQKKQETKQVQEASQKTSQEEEAKQESRSGSSRKVSQEPISAASVMSHQSANSQKSSAAKAHNHGAPKSAVKPATSNQANQTTNGAMNVKEGQADSGHTSRQQSPIRRMQAAIQTMSNQAKQVTSSSTKEEEGQVDSGQTGGQQSPIRRVQAAIQMFTAKSASKPVTKPMATPSKLPWLNKGQQYPQKSTTDAVTSQQTQHEAPNVQSQVQPKTDSKLTAKPVRRPGMGLQQSANNGSSSALKSSRFLTKGNPNTASNEARKARIAEMREKSKPVAKPAFTATKDFSAATLSSMKSKAGAVAEDKENKRRILTAQMREKAAARKQAEMAAKETKSVATASQQEPKQSNSSVTEVPEEPPASKVPVEQDTHPMSSAKPKTPSAKDQDYLAELRPQLLSPMDTYEISDREDSDSESEESESEDEDEKNPRKKIPDWAQRVNLLPALEKQFAEGVDRIDPDEIFSEVQTCDLTAIFNSKRSRYLRRTSSGNWTKDKVTAVEKLTYKRTMGYGQSRLQT